MANKYSWKKMYEMEHANLLELQAAAQNVLDNWANDEDGNDLAGAVNGLETLLPEPRQV